MEWPPSTSPPRSGSAGSEVNKGCSKSKVLWSGRLQRRDHRTGPNAGWEAGGVVKARFCGVHVYTVASIGQEGVLGGTMGGCKKKGIVELRVTTERGTKGRVDVWRRGGWRKKKVLG